MNEVKHNPVVYKRSNSLPGANKSPVKAQNTKSQFELLQIGEENCDVGELMANSKYRSDKHPFSLLSLKSNTRAIDKQEVVDKKMTNMHTTTSIKTKHSITQDIEGPINSQMFFQHSSNKKLTDDYTVGDVIG
jgi:serine/threonine protein kinase